MDLKENRLISTASRRRDLNTGRTLLCLLHLSGLEVAWEIWGPGEPQWWWTRAGEERGRLGLGGCVLPGTEVCLWVSTKTRRYQEPKIGDPEIVHRLVKLFHDEELTGAVKNTWRHAMLQRQEAETRTLNPGVLQPRIGNSWRSLESLCLTGGWIMQLVQIAEIPTVLI